ncbi:MAG: 23S rRNA (adenine(2503)-C(2))-methyltransferase RlmN [Nitrospiraceae bacterium]|nr:23S rRNA (adenine(2503)-C(2))-methyltransferase RlmN [Nitrospiraceae bacterium]
MSGRVNLKALSREDLFRFILERGLPRFRAEQLLHWVYERYVADISGVTEFSKKLRDDLGAVAYLSCPEVAQRLTSRDGTEKFLFRLEDGETIESVLIPDDKRLTLCISSQAGCAMGCEFCLTGSHGLKRNLQAYEIVDQVLSVNRMIRMTEKGRGVTNIVLMGMGEPLANLDAVAEALRRITGLLGISKRRITLSTSGLAPKLAELASKAPDVNLAVSLNASTDEVRSRIMPVNRKYPLRTLLDACRKFPLGPMRRITFEYVLIGGLNDSESDARRLVGLVKGIRCKINLIPFNPHPGSAFTRPSEERVLAFQKVLVKHDLAALIRESKGQDILAACGQLRAAQP